MDLKTALASYKAAASERERFERKTMIEFAVHERADGLRAGSAYVIPLRLALGQYDQQQRRFPIRLHLDVDGRNAMAGKQCLAPHALPSGTVTACLSSGSLLSNDPIFSFLPVADATQAASYAARYAKGQLQISAIAMDAGPPVLERAVSSGTLWTQPVSITGLLLIDPVAQQLLSTAKAQEPPRPLPGSMPAAEPLPATTGGTLAGVPPRAGDPFVPVPGPAGPGKVRQYPPEVRPTGDGSNTPSARPELDRLLSLLSLAVYSNPHGVLKLNNEIASINAKIDRIGRDTGRQRTIRDKELRNLALKLESKLIELAEYDEMLEIKQAFPRTHGLVAVDLEKAERTDKLYYEYYRSRDGRHIIVFRGSSTLTDFETDFQLATTPETLAEMAAHLQKGGNEGVMAGARNHIAGWMQERSASQMSQNPAAFHLADKLLERLKKNGVNPADIVLTGHSLGGALAQFAGLRHGVGQVVTFNPAPLSPRQLELLADFVPARMPDVRNYIAFVPAENHEGGTFDPISSALADLTGLRNPASLRVLGDKRTVTVCNDLEAEGFKIFSNRAQGLVTGMTTGVMASGRGSLVKGGAAIGAIAGGGGASTDHGSAITTGGAMGYRTGKYIAAGLNCVGRPFLCSAVAAAGGVASVYVRMQVVNLWAMYSAHSIKRMYESLNDVGLPTCSPAAGSSFTTAAAQQQLP